MQTVSTWFEFDGQWNIVTPLEVASGKDLGSILDKFANAGILFFHSLPLA
jgi:hypothetical protein